MKCYASLHIPPDELALFEKIEKVVQEMPEVELGRDENGREILVSCHMLTRALARFFPVECRDGYFGDMFEHSWLVTRSGMTIDPYPMALVGGPILVDTRFPAPWGHLYRASTLPNLSDVRFLENVGKVTEVVRETIEKLFGTNRNQA